MFCFSLKFSCLSLSLAYQHGIQYHGMPRPHRRGSSRQLQLTRTITTKSGVGIRYTHMLILSNRCCFNHNSMMTGALFLSYSAQGHIHLCYSKDYAVHHTHEIRYRISILMHKYTPNMNTHTHTHKYIQKEQNNTPADSFIISSNVFNWGGEKKLFVWEYRTDTHIYRSCLQLSLS